MVSYAIEYEIKGSKYEKLVDARDLKSAKRKIGKKHGYKDGRMVKIKRVTICGYL